jgi:hypothetical protein
MAIDPVCFAIVDEDGAEFRTTWKNKGVLLLHRILPEAVS